MENIELKLFTVADLKAYFVHNQKVDLLSERVITPTRAYATINNPYATDDMAVVSAIFVDNEVAAYTYVFPDKLARPDRTIYWNTVLYVDPKFEGRGYGYMVIGQMLEIYGDDYFDLDAVPASVENLKYAGLIVEETARYKLRNKHYAQSSLGHILSSVDSLKNIFNRKRRKFVESLKHVTYQLEYANYIDEQTYQFIESHSVKDVFLRSREMLNWIMTYPMRQTSPLTNRVENPCFFTSTQQWYDSFLVRVIVNKKMVGLYIIHESDMVFSLDYLYYDEAYKLEVFSSIGEHIRYFHTHRFITSNQELAEFLYNNGLFRQFNLTTKTFSHPATFDANGKTHIQVGEGDNFI